MFFVVIICLKQIFLGTRKFWGALPPNVPLVVTGLVLDFRCKLVAFLELML